MPLTGLATGARGYGLFGAFGPRGGFDSIATITATGGETSLTFSSIPQTYTALQIRGSASSTYNTNSDNAVLSIRLNGVDTTGSYINHQLHGDGFTTAVAASDRTSSMAVGVMSRSPSHVDIFAGFVIDIHDYTSTTRNKTVRSMAGYDWATGTFNTRIGLHSGLFINTSAVTSVTLIPTIGFAANSTFALYGIRGA